MVILIYFHASLLIAACPGFGVSFNLAFSQIDPSRSSSLVLLVLNAPISLLSGLLIGFCSAYGQFALTRWALTSRLLLAPGGGRGREREKGRGRGGCFTRGTHMHEHVRVLLLSAHFRAGLLLAVSIAVVFLLDEAGFSAGGYLAVMVQACALASWWNELQTEHQHKMKLKLREEDEGEPVYVPPVLVSVSGGGVTKSEHGTKKREGRCSYWFCCSCGEEVEVEVGAGVVSALYKTLWTHAQPLLFMLIGAQVLLRDLSASSLSTAALILLLATSVRLLVTYLSVSTSAVLVTRERLFVCLAWLPKATVQVRLHAVYAVQGCCAPNTMPCHSIPCHTIPVIFHTIRTHILFGSNI